MNTRELIRTNYFRVRDEAAFRQHLADMYPHDAIEVGTDQEGRVTLLMPGGVPSHESEDENGDVCVIGTPEDFLLNLDPFVVAPALEY